MSRPKAGYRLKSGQKVPGVTTITSRFGDKDALIGWSYNQGYDHGSEGLPKNRFAKVTEAGDIGTYVHNLIEWNILGANPPEPSPDPSLTEEAIARGRNGFNQFVEWIEQTHAHVIAWEEPLVSERYAYGGTIDGIFEMPSHTDVGDWKTARRFYPENLLQIAGGYTLLIEENFPGWKIDGIQIVRFSKDAEIFDHRRIGSGKLIEVAKRQFLRLREAWEDDQFIKQSFGS